MNSDEFYKEIGLLNNNGDLLFTIMPRLNFIHFWDDVLYSHLYKEAENCNNQELKIGQLIFTEEDFIELTDHLNVDRQTIDDSLNRLNRLDLVSFEKLSQNHGLLITIENYMEFHKTGAEQLASNSIE
ncbi:hypothetical protein P9D79_00030 [Bacillus haynesii]|uniref:hypothetical protein n=1 Tax=Bacillus haynesii TaxID=1925021 RepID=UPI00227FD378|nr:hypothetical protein [Bacillus haynesii]MCY8144342.1 hypothetical protein [Bacillus haynesii]MEC1455364.1 hypothetical protein [Bacillus haynesii]MEC1571354.1 hypothetical protein [Bacillus haynesii]